jgi:endonuclease-8
MSVTTVRAHGKHLLIDFEPVLTLQVHLGMSGWWRVVSRGGEDSAAVNRNDSRLRLYLATERGEAGCFAAPTIQTFARSERADRLTPLSNLGPDLRVEPGKAPEIAAMALARLRARSPDRELLADALLDQTVAAGLGNVYKSEVAFHQGVWPFTAVSGLSDEKLIDIFVTASRLLWTNSQDPGRPRSTTPHGGTFVYRRHRSPCRRCQTSIERSYQGRVGRSTYWCPRCQPSTEPRV